MEEKERRAEEGEAWGGFGEAKGRSGNINWKLKNKKRNIKIVHLVCAICGLKSDEIILMFLFYF